MSSSLTMFINLGQPFKLLLLNYACRLFEEEIKQSEWEFIDFFFSRPPHC